MTAIRPGLLVLLALLPAAALAASADTTGAPVPVVIVTAEGGVWGTGSEPQPFHPRPEDGHLGEALENLAGVWAVRRAASGTEPVIRGLGFERVRTRLGAVPLHGACPGRMDPPTTYLSGPVFTGVTVSWAAGVEAGEGGIAGTIQADPDYDRGTGAEPGYSPFLSATYESARNGYGVEAGVAGGSEDLDVRAALGHRSADDYDAPDGRTVPAGLKESTANLALGWRPADGHRLWTAAAYVHEEDIVYTALPMDNRDTDFLVWNGGWRHEGDGKLQLTEITGGFSAVDHLMDNADKPNLPTMEAATEGETRTWALRGRADLDLGTWDARLGLDATRVGKDALRERYMVAMDTSFFDRMWPDARQTTLGGSVSLGRNLGTDLRLAIEGRIDAVDNEARAADDPSLGGLTVREQYVAYYGAAAGETDRSETLGQVAVRLGGSAAGGTWRLRTGLAGRSAGISERYLAFAPTAGGYLVGDPSLDVEKAWQSEVGYNYGWNRLTVGAALHHQRIKDYVLQTVVDRRDINGDSIDDAIKGYVNTNATLMGGEFMVEARPCPRLVVPMTLALVQGRNTTHDRDLPEIPPLSGTAEARFLAHGGTDSWVRLGARFAADQENIDPVFGEDRTGGWTVWHLGLETRPLEKLTVSMSVENFFDRLYNDHLTREAVLPVGGLAKGDEVPALGRSFRVSARWGF